MADIHPIVNRLRIMAETWPTNTPEHQAALTAAACVEAVIAYGKAAQHGTVEECSSMGPRILDLARQLKEIRT